MSGKQIARTNEMNRRNAAASRARAGISGHGMAMTAFLMVASMISGFFGRWFGGSSKENRSTASLPQRPCLACGKKTGHPNGCCSSEHYRQWINSLGSGRGFGRIVKPLYL